MSHGGLQIARQWHSLGIQMTASSWTGRRFCALDGLRQNFIVGPKLYQQMVRFQESSASLLVTGCEQRLRGDIAEICPEGPHVRAEICVVPLCSWRQGQAQSVRIHFMFKTHGDHIALQTSLGKVDQMKETLVLIAGDEAERYEQLRSLVVAWSPAVLD